MPEQALARWESALNLLASRQILGQGHLALLRMTRVLDVEGVIVLIVDFPLPRDIIERNRAAFTAALEEVWGHPITFEVTIDPSHDSRSSMTSPVSHQTSQGTSTTPAPPTPQAPSATTQAGYFSPEPHLSSASASAPTPTPSFPSGTAEQQDTQPDYPDYSADHSPYATYVPQASDDSASTPESYPPIPPLPQDAEQRRPAPAEASTAPTTVSVPQPLTVAAPTATDHATTGAPASGHIPDDSRLNPRYTFTTYVQGKSNRLARTAAAAVAEAPSKAYNPLFIYGGSGLGKTHLLHAIGHYARSLYPGITVKYVNSEEFVSDFIASVADGQMRNFKDRYRNVDILLVDDVQFFEGKEQTLEEFFHTFNALRIAEKQIVLTADQPAGELKGFNTRLVSRFQEGLVADVQPPDLETRQAILTLKARADGIEVSEDVLEYIASRVTTNIRELEGALVRVTAFASLNKQPIDRTIAEMALKDVISDPDGEEVSSALIMAHVAEYFDMSIEDLCGESRRKNFVHPRHIAMYLCRELTDLSLPNIGREFGGRDHTTVMNAHRKVATQMGERRETFNEVNELTGRIKQAAQASRL